MALFFPDGTVIEFDEHFYDDDPGSGWIEYTIYQIATVVEGTPRPDTRIYEFTYLARQPWETDDEGFDYQVTHHVDVVNQDFFAFDNLAYLTVYTVASTTIWDYDAKPDIVSHGADVYVAYVGANGGLRDLYYGFPADSLRALFDQARGHVGLLWLDDLQSDELRLTLASVDAQGHVVRRSERIEATGILPPLTSEALVVQGPLYLVNGEMVIVLSCEGTAALGFLSARFDLVGSLLPIEGELVGVVTLPDGGAVVASVVRDASGGGATIEVRGYDEDHVASDPLRISVPSFERANIGLNADGTVAISGSGGGVRFDQTYLPAGLTRHGDAAPEVITGTTWRDTLFGEAGNDQLIGRGGADSLYGGDGSDVLVGGFGADLLDGGAGSDAVRYDSKVVVNLADPGRNTGEAAGDVLVALEQVRGSASNDRLQGDAGRNIFQGRDGDDVLSGGAGDDILVGNAGADRLRGGAGIDQFRYGSLLDAGDTIADFEHGIDKIALRAGGFGIDAIQLVVGATPVATSADGTFLFSTATGLLSFDADGTGSGAAVGLAALSNAPTLARSDFMLIG